MQTRTSFERDLLLYQPNMENHWSIIGVFHKAKAIVHCDSLATQQADKVTFNSTLEYLCKAFAYLKQSVDMKRFKLKALAVQHCNIKLITLAVAYLHVYMCISVLKTTIFPMKVLRLSDIGLLIFFLYS